MESIENAVSVKEEPNDSWPHADDVNNFNSIDCREVKNFETSTFREPSVNHANEFMVQKQLDGKMFIDFECKYEKLEPTSFSTTIYKSEYLPIVKKGSENQNNSEGQSEDPLQFTLKTHINEVHSHKKPFKCDICHKSFSVKKNRNRHIKLVHDRKKFFECDICHKKFKLKAYVNTHINGVHN